MLSFRAWEDMYERYCHRYMHLAPTGSSIWEDSVLPVVLQMMVELLKLFTAILQQSSPEGTDFLIKVSDHPDFVVMLFEKLWSDMFRKWFYSTPHCNAS